MTVDGATSFNQNIGNWDVSRCDDFEGFLNGAASFRQNLCSWIGKIQEGSRVELMFTGSGCEALESPDLGLEYPTPLCFECIAPTNAPTSSPAPTITPGPTFSPTSTAMPTAPTQAPTVALKAFEDIDELVAAVDLYVADPSPETPTAIVYGWPIGKWDVSKVRTTRE